MKQDIDCLIETLRLKASEAYFYSIAADRLEELSKQLEVAKKDVQALSRELGEFKGWHQPYRPEWVRKDPSRLEIAAMLKAGWFANRDADFNATDHKWWIEQADKLIAAAKEAQ